MAVLMQDLAWKKLVFEDCRELSERVALLCRGLYDSVLALGYRNSRTLALRNYWTAWSLFSIPVPFFWIKTCLAWCVWPSGVLVQSLCSDTGVTTMCMIWRVVLMLNVQFVWLFLFYVKRNFAVSLSVTTDSPTKVIAKHQGCIAWPIMQFKWVYWKKTVGANAFLKATLNVLSIWLFLCFLWWGDNPYLWWKRLQSQKLFNLDV